jgi:hypothetical protein
LDQTYYLVSVQDSTYFLYPLVITLQDWSVNYVRKLKCQPSMEGAQLGMHTLQALLANVLRLKHHRFSPHQYPPVPEPPTPTTP